MAKTEKVEQIQASESATKTTQTIKTVKAQKFPLEKLRANCKKLFGITTHEFVGATYGMTGEYTVEEVKAQIEKWRGMEVK